jgi:hypothetical protein
MSSITVCFPEQIVVCSMLSAGISGCTVVVHSFICITSFCFNFIPLYSLLRFLCVYFLTFTVFIFRHYLLSNFAIGTYIFYIYFFFLFLFRLIFFLQQTLSNDAIFVTFLDYFAHTL